MSRELLLFRHAKSAWDTDAPSDFERPLSKRGRKASTRMGKWVREQALLPDAIICSPAARTEETVRRMLKAASLPASLVSWEPIVYEATLPDLLHVLTTCPADHARVMLVGHNPGLEMLLEYLTELESTIFASGKLMPTGAIARLRMPDDWTALDKRCAHLDGIVRPREIDAVPTAPAPDGLTK